MAGATAKAKKAAPKKAPVKRAAPRARAAETSAPAKTVTSPTGDGPAKKTARRPAKPAAGGPAEPDGDKPVNQATRGPAEPDGGKPVSQAASGSAEPDGDKPVKRAAPTKRLRKTTPVEAAPESPASEAPTTAEATTPEPSAERTVVKTEPAKTGSTPSPALDQLALDLWPHLLSDPRNATKLLARTAVETLGPRAAAWAAHTRATYPAATPKGVARLATAQFTRTAERRGLLSALSGPYAPIALVATAALTHAELVLHLAAAYGLDPSDPERVAELLVLLPSYRGGAAWAALRLADRVLPGAALLGAVLGGRNAAEAVAVRAERRYGWYFNQSSQESGSSS